MVHTSLKGLRVLVLEDDFYIADDASNTLSEAGAEVLGPYASDAQAIAAIEVRRPDCAVLDLNLGDGQTFVVARALRALGTPMVFATGYNQEMVPADLAGAVHLPKPFSDKQLLAAVLRACAS